MVAGLVATLVATLVRAIVSMGVPCMNVVSMITWCRGTSSGDSILNMLPMSMNRVTVWPIPGYPYPNKLDMNTAANMSRRWGVSHGWGGGNKTARNNNTSNKLLHFSFSFSVISFDNVQGMPELDWTNKQQIPYPRHMSLSEWHMNMLFHSLILISPVSESVLVVVRLSPIVYHV